MSDLYPTYRECLLDPRQEELLKAVMFEWKQSDIKADPAVMLQTLDAVDAIILNTYDLPGSVRKAVERAVERAKVRAAEEKKRLEEGYRLWMFTDPPAPESEELGKVLKEIKGLKKTLRRSGNTTAEAGRKGGIATRKARTPAKRSESARRAAEARWMSGTQKRKPRAKKIRAGSKAKRTKAKT